MVEVTAALAFLAGVSFSSLVKRMSPGPRQDGLAEQLLWGVPVVGSETILNVDGSFSTGLRLICPDFMSCSESDLIQIGRTVNSAICALGDNWLVHYDVIRVPAPGYPDQGAFPGGLSGAIDQERRERFGVVVENFQSLHVLVVTYVPPPEVYNKARAFFFDDSAPTASLPWREHWEGFEKRVEILETTLRRVFSVDRLSVDAFASHLRLCLTGREQAVKVPAGDVAVRDVVVSEDLVGGYRPRLGDDEIRVVAVRGYPSEPEAGGFDWFHSLPFPVRSSSRIFPLSRRAGLRLVNRRLMAWYTRGVAPSKNRAAVFSSHHASGMAEDAQLAVADVESGATLYAAYTWSVVVMDPSSATATRRAEAVVEGLSAQGFTCSIEGVNSVAAYLGALPCHGAHNVRLPLISIRNLADLMATTSPHLGSAFAPSGLYPPKSPPALWAKTEGSSPYRLHLVSEGVPHGLLIGRTGVGKSVLVQLLSSQALRWPGSQVYVFDVDYSSAFAGIASGALHYDIGGEAREAIEFQPLAGVDQDRERQWALGWLMQLLEVQGISYDPAHESDLSQALDVMAVEEVEHRTLSYLRSLAQVPAVKAALEAYTVAGGNGGLLDGSRDGLRSGRLQIFEMTHLLRSSTSTRLTVPVLLYLFHRIEESLTGTVSHIFIEEAWLPLLDETFSRVIESWLRRLRKMNCGVYLVTQSPEEVLAAENAKVILDSCPTRFFCPDTDAVQPSGRELYGSLGLSEKEILTLSSAEPKRQYLHHTPTASRLFELQLDPLALALMTPQKGRTVHEMYQLALELRSRHGEHWVRRYLADAGLERWAEFLPRAVAAA